MKSENIITLDNLSSSATAQRYGIDNTPPEAATRMLAILMHRVIEPIEREWDGRLIVASGYRCPQLNALLEGSRHSHHILGCAVDLTAGSKKANKRLRHLLLTMKKEGRLRATHIITDKQLRWVHVAYVPSFNQKSAPR
jgi:uncharacterized protein YcbK (DUF882 family)